MDFGAAFTTDLRELVEHQHGMVSSRRLAAAGVSLEFARARVRCGRWQQPQRGVFATFSGPVDRIGAIWAAVLRCGNGATVSHESAAELDALIAPEPAAPVHVTIPASRRVRGTLPGIVVHHAHRLEQTRHPARMPPQTRIEATVLDLVDVAPSARRAADWLITACQRRHTTPDRLAAHLAQRKKIRWRAMAESMLLDVAQGAHSMLEVRHLRSVERAHGLPQGTRQRRVSDGRVIWIDVDYAPFDVRTELDGRVGHYGEGMFRDRRRDNRAVVDGAVTLRYGHADIFGTPCAVAAEQAAVLRAHGWAGMPTPCGPDCPVMATLADHRHSPAA